MIKIPSSLKILNNSVIWKYGLLDLPPQLYLLENNCGFLNAGVREVSLWHLVSSEHWNLQSLFYIFSHKSCFQVVCALKDRLLDSNISSYVVKLLNYNSKTNSSVSLSVSVVQMTSKAFDSYKITGGCITTKFYCSLKNS